MNEELPMNIYLKGHKLFALVFLEVIELIQFRRAIFLQTWCNNDFSSIIIILSHGPTKVGGDYLLSCILYN